MKKFILPFTFMAIILMLIVVNFSVYNIGRQDFINHLQVVMVRNGEKMDRTYGNCGHVQDMKSGIIYEACGVESR